MRRHGFHCAIFFVIDDAGWGDTQLALFSGDGLGGVIPIVGQAVENVVCHEKRVEILKPQFL